MKTTDLARTLVELSLEMTVMPASYRSDLRQMLREKMDERDPMLLCRQCLEYLSMGVKYMNFDLEATRRENEYLRTILENQSGG